MSSSRRPNSTGYRRGAPNASGASTGKHKGLPGLSQERRQIVGQYMVGKTIGEGTFGKVKLAVHIPTGEKVAVKILEKNRIKEQADVRRVNREIKILKKARHGNVIQLYEVLDTRNTIYLIMECAEGGEMFDYIVAQKRVAEPQACKFLHQILDGLEVLHNNDITHRDLKPENLLLKATSDGWVVKIVDFGLSNTHEGGRLLTTACGSPCYAAPEMIAGKKYVGPLADLWSTGVILFALVSGYLPFEDPNTSLLYKKILAADYKFPKWISLEVRELIGCILETDPSKRYTISLIRNHPWYRQVQESEVPHDDSTSRNNSRRSKRPVNNQHQQPQHYLPGLQQLKSSTHHETLVAIKAAGMDPQAVLDSVVSQAFNSMTAMYYLLEQKHRNLSLKKDRSTSSKQIRQNSSNLSKPETTAGPAGAGASASSGATPAEHRDERFAVVGGETQHQRTAHAPSQPQQPKQVLKFLRPSGNNNNRVRVSGVPNSSDLNQQQEHDKQQQQQHQQQQEHHRNHSHHNRQQQQQHQQTTAPYLQVPALLQKNAATGAATGAAAGNTNSQHSHQHPHHHQHQHQHHHTNNKEAALKGNLDDHVFGNSGTAAPKATIDGLGTDSGVPAVAVVAAGIPPLTTKMKDRVPLLAINAQQHNQQHHHQQQQQQQQDKVYVSQTSRPEAATESKPIVDPPTSLTARAELPSLAGSTAAPASNENNRKEKPSATTAAVEKPTFTTVTEENVTHTAPAQRKASIEVKTGSGIDAIVLSASSRDQNNSTRGTDTDSNAASTSAPAAATVTPAAVVTATKATASAAEPTAVSNATANPTATAPKAPLEPRKPAAPSSSAVSGASAGGSSRRGRNISFSGTTKPPAGITATPTAATPTAASSMVPSAPTKKPNNLSNSDQRQPAAAAATAVATAPTLSGSLKQKVSQQQQQQSTASPTGHAAPHAPSAPPRQNSGKASSQQAVNGAAATATAATENGVAAVNPRTKALQNKFAPAQQQKPKP